MAEMEDNTIIEGEHNITKCPKNIKEVYYKEEPTISEQLINEIETVKIEFEDGDEEIEGTNNVQFSAFFLRDLDGDGYAEKLKGSCKEIPKEYYTLFS